MTSLPFTLRAQTNKEVLSRIATLALLAFAVVPSWAQNTNGQSGGCQAAKEQGFRKYLSATSALDQQEQRVKEQANQRKASCGHDRGCIQKIELDEQQALRSTEKQVAAENTRHEKADIDIEHNPPCEQFSLPEAPCDRDRATEARRYSLNSATLAKKKIDDFDLYVDDMTNCGLSGSCKNDANKQQEQRLTNWRKQVDEENQRHQQELRTISTGVNCEPPRIDPELSEKGATAPERSREAPNMVNAPRQTARGLDPGTKRQLIDTENRRHAIAVDGIRRLMDQEIQNHQQNLKRAGLDANQVAKENQIYAAHIHLLQVQLDQEANRSKAAITAINAR